MASRGCLGSGDESDKIDMPVYGLSIHIGFRCDADLQYRDK